MKRTIVFTTMALALFPMVVMSSSAEGTDNADSTVTRAKQHYQFALQHRQAGNTDEAISQLEQSIALYDSLAQVYYAYGEILGEIGDRERAIEAFENALALNPEYYNAAARLAKLYYETEDYGLTLEMYKLMYTLRPDNTVILASIANIQEFLGDREGARDNLIQLAEMGQDSYDNLMRIAVFSFEKEDWESAHMYATLALGKKSRDAKALELAGRTCLLMNDQEAAIRFYRPLAEIDTTSLAIIKTAEDIYRRLSDKENLIWALKRHHELEPDNVNVLGELCENLYPDRLVEEGVEYVRRGIALAPADGRFHILLGENYRMLGMDREALEEFRIALDDSRWASNAERLIWQIERPESDEEKAEREFFNRGK